MYDFSIYTKQPKFEDTPFCSPRNRQLVISKSIYKSFLDSGSKDIKLDKQDHNFVG